MQTSKSKATDNTILQDIYKLSHIWVIVWTTVQMDITKCFLKGILIEIQVSR